MRRKPARVGSSCSEEKGLEGLEGLEGQRRSRATTKTHAEKYPEHQRLKAVREKSQAIWEFLEWLKNEKGVGFADPYEHLTTRGLLAEYFDIDEEKIENEKLAMLAELRGDDDDIAVPA